MPVEPAASEPHESSQPAARSPAVFLDPRILQANERTLLAWVRTSLGLMAFGFVIARLGLWLRATRAGDGAEGAGSGASVALGAAVVAFGAVTCIAAALRYRAARARFLRGELAPSGAGLEMTLAAGVAIAGACLCAYLLVR